LDTKTHWTLEELHRALGCQKFRNYKHILQPNLDGQWVDGGKFSLSIGAYTTIPKAPWGGAINWEESCYLDIDHVEIALGDCIAPGGNWYVLILVNQANRYNWVFELKELSRDSILSAFCLFCGDAGSYAQCFCSDCDAKLFGTKIHEHLINNNSNIVAVAAGQQSANGLVELHWKVVCVNLSSGLVRPFPILEVTKPCWLCLPP
jgi:hypothetical protein